MPRLGSYLLLTAFALVAFARPAAAAPVDDKIVPLGPVLTPPPTPPGNPFSQAKADLGKALFWEEQISSTLTVACGTCHRPAAGGSDPRSSVHSRRSTHPGANGLFGDADDLTGSPGVPLNLANGAYSSSPLFGIVEQVTRRKSQSVVDAAYASELFWDGRARSQFRDPITNAEILASGGALESQSVIPPLSDVEMAHVGGDWADAASRIAAARPLALSPSVPAALESWIGGRSYPELFEEVYGSPEVTPARIAMAIATYERTLWSDESPVDLGLAELTPQELSGRGAFVEAGCAACHPGTLLTDNQYHYIGVRPADEDPGRRAVTNSPADQGAFRTPRLRNVELRAPYMHSGRFATLEDVLDFYNRGGDFDAPNKDERIVPLNLTPQQKADIIAFLKRPLTDPRVAAETGPFERPLLFAESDRVPKAIGKGIRGSGGFHPKLVALEPPMAGNPNFTVGIYGALGGAHARLVVDDIEPGPTPPLAPFYASPLQELSGSGALAGYGSASLPISAHESMIGREFFGRWYVVDPRAWNGIASTPAFRITIFGVGVPNAAGPAWSLYE